MIFIRRNGPFIFGDSDVASVFFNRCGMCEHATALSRTVCYLTFIRLFPPDSHDFRRLDWICLQPSRRTLIYFSTHASYFLCPNHPNWAEVFATRFIYITSGVLSIPCRTETHWSIESEKQSQYRVLEYRISPYTIVIERGSLTWESRGQKEIKRTTRE